MPSANLTALQLRVLWWRISLPFRWAHKPLCERFSDHVWTIGGMHVCRSCTIAYAAAALAATAALLTGTDPAPLAMTLIPVTALGSIPRFYARRSRPARDFLRAMLGASLALALLWMLTAPAIGGPVVAALAVGGIALQRLRSERAKDACSGCPHESARGVCPGFALQASHARRFEALASELVTLTAPAPRCITGSGANGRTHR